MSLQTNGLEYAMGITGMRNVFSLSEAEMKAWLKKHRGGGFLSCPEYFLRHYRLTNKFFRGRPCFILNPRVSTGHENSYLFFIHGGGYTLEMNIFEWRFIYRLAMGTGMSVVIPYLPLAPEKNCEDSMKMLYSIYQYLRGHTVPSRVHLIGVSSGGGIALSFAQLLRKKNCPPCGNVVLLSPFLNFDVPNDQEWLRMQEIAPHDKLLSPELFYMLGKWWGSPRRRNDYLVSPFYGNLNGIGKISIFTGTHDVLNVYANELYERAVEEDAPVDLYEYIDTPHMWMLFPGPEARNAFRAIRRVLVKSRL